MKIRSILIFILIIAVFAFLLTGVREGYSEHGKQQLEVALRRTAVACYAAEGFYPPSVDYMKARYGLQYDESVYTVRYVVFASNLMPDFTVLEATR